MPTYIPPWKIFSNPLRPARHWYVSQPFLEGRELVIPKGIGWQGIEGECGAQILQEEAQAPTPPVVAQVEIYRIYHEFIAKELSRLGRNAAFETAVVPDMALRHPKKLGVDHASDLNRLSYETIKLFERHPEITEPDVFCFVPVSPVLVPYYVRKNPETGEYDAPAVFGAEIEKTNRLMGKKFKMGDSVRRLEARFRRGIYKFSPAMYRTDIAKEFFPREDPKKLERYCTFNRYVMINMYLAVMDLAGIEEIYLYALKDSYATDIIGKTAKISGRSLLQPSIMRNIQYPEYSECEPSALSIREGYITQTWREYESSRSEVRPVPA